jgi:hypothetical protein
MKYSVTLKGQKSYVCAVMGRAARPVAEHDSKLQVIRSLTRQAFIDGDDLLLC